MSKISVKSLQKKNIKTKTSEIKQNHKKPLNNYKQNLPLKKNKKKC